MSCSNCFNGCSDIISDQCVRYTGIDVPVLGIKSGDSLSYVEQALITFLTSTLDGTGIKIDINPAIICTLVQKYLPTCGDLTAVDLFNALIKAVCDLQVQVNDIVADILVINAEIATIEADYDVNCLTGVSAGDGTHDILQATLDQLCAFIIDVQTNYVQIADLDTLIADYLANLPASTLVSQKMVPYIAYEYYGTLTNFDATGAGIGVWDKIYVCNGLNGTPDRRGVVAVGAIQSVPGGPLSSIVNPSSSLFNPNYTFGGGIIGTNSITLTVNQLASHTHTPTVTPPTHSHTFNYSIGHEYKGSDSNDAVQSIGTGTSNQTTSEVSIIVENASTGGNTPHANNQPAIAAYYIMYRP
jgi:hypothetical protein